ncbi:MAG: tetratricopeptide repeat protein [Candidatus Omnitrophica bacterium]|nr:tetratricopeptide repeat protein [Candidatus Omnitrophota bacterium]
MRKIFFISLFFWLGINSGEAKIFSRDAIDYRMKGYLAWQNKDYDEAIKFLQKSCLLDPCYAPPHNDLGIIYEMKGWSERAEKEYLRALSIDPNYGEAMMNLALLYISRGLTEKAVPYLQRRIEIGSPDDPWVQKARSLLSQYAPQLYKELTQKEEARNLLYQALEEKLKGTKLSSPPPSVGKKEETLPQKEPETTVSQDIENYLRLERDLARPGISNYLLGLSPQGIIFLYGKPFEKKTIVGEEKEIFQPEWYNRWIAHSEFGEITRDLFIQDGKRRKERWIYKIPSRYKKYALKPEISLIFEDNKLVSWEK